MKKLLYHTLGYPSDLYTERSFALPEIKALRSVYDEIIIIPTSDFGNKFGYEKELPEGVKVDWTIARDSIVHSRMMRLPYLAHPFVIRTLVEMCGEARTPGQFGSGFLSAATTVRVASLLEKITLRHSMTRDNTTLYSLWMAGAFNGMARFAMRHKQRLFARAHGFDIRKEPDNFRSDRMRKRLLYGVDKVFMIADGARCKMEELFPEHADRFETIRLGSSRLFSPHSLNLDSDTIRIVTSARFVRLKRLPETLEILGEAADLIPDRKIEWTIFGDGEELPRFKNQLETSQRPNLRVNIAGMTDNTEIQRQLASGEIHWFLLLSSTEGIPVSLGEAMSYGIPSIVTDVGQVTELATPQTSVIIEPELKERSRIAAKIAKALPDLELRSRLGRQSLRTWEMSFNADTRARHLANIIAGG